MDTPEVKVPLTAVSCRSSITQLREPRDKASALAAAQQDCCFLEKIGQTWSSKREGISGGRKGKQKIPGREDGLERGPQRRGARMWGAEEPGRRRFQDVRPCRPSGAVSQRAPGQGVSAGEVELCTRGPVELPSRGSFEVGVQRVKI